MPATALPLITRLLRATADFYGAPVVTCPMPSCRRARSCQYPARKFDPACARDLDPEILNTILIMATRMLAGEYSTLLTRDENKRELEEIAIEIAKRIAAQDQSDDRIFRDFLRRYRTPPMSDADFKAFQAQVKAEYAESRRSVEKWSA